MNLLKTVMKIISSPSNSKQSNENQASGKPKVSVVPLSPNIIKTSPNSIEKSSSPRKLIDFQNSLSSNNFSNIINSTNSNSKFDDDRFSSETSNDMCSDNSEDLNSGTFDDTDFNITNTLKTKKINLRNSGEFFKPLDPNKVEDNNVNEITIDQANSVSFDFNASSEIRTISQSTKKDKRIEGNFHAPKSIIQDKSNDEDQAELTLRDLTRPIDKNNNTNAEFISPKGTKARKNLITSNNNSNEIKSENTDVPEKEDIDDSATLKEIGKDIEKGSNEVKHDNLLTDKDIQFLNATYEFLNNQMEISRQIENIPEFTKLQSILQLRYSIDVGCCKEDIIDTFNEEKKEFISNCYEYLMNTEKELTSVTEISDDPALLPSNYYRSR